MTGIGDIDRAIGLYISINIDTEQIMRVVRTSNAKKKIEVMVRYRDCEKEYTLHEFLQKLGFE